MTNDRLRGGLGGLCPPSQKPGGLGGSAPQPKIFRNISKNFEKNPRDLYFTNAPLYYDSPLLEGVRAAMAAGLWKQREMTSPGGSCKASDDLNITNHLF